LANLSLFSTIRSYSQIEWNTYKKVNAQFCKEILKLYRSNDIIWVHDYQQLLLSSLLREKLPHATIGFFQHIPFPSYEMFRNIPWRDEILKGYLGADLIGFHTYDDAQQFLNCCKQILGLENNLGQIFYNNRVCFVDAFPMGIDFDKFNESAKSIETKTKVTELYGNLKDKKIILSIDRLDYSKGIIQRLEAFEEFLLTFPEYCGKIVYILLTVPSRYEIETYKKLKQQIDEKVGNINGRFSKVNWTPIHYIFRTVPFSHLSTLYALADIALITPLRDGMNLISKEYVASRYNENGVLILSETAESAKELTEALIINPNSKKQLVNALNKALTMGNEEQKKRMSYMRSIVKTYNVHQWLNLFNKRLAYCKEYQKHINKKIIHEKNNDFLVKLYQKAQKRLLLLDYDGTLVPFYNQPQEAYPDKEIQSILRIICADPKNKVVIVTGRERETIEYFMKDFHVDIVAEHGVWIRKDFDKWTLSGQQTENWKPRIKQFLNEFVLRTPGSFIEEKEYSLVWHFRNTDSEFGQTRARELVSNLNYLINTLNLQLLVGNKVVEIKDSSINKGKALLPWLVNDYDFILAIGDDQTDEDMFRMIPLTGISIKVGYKATAANYTISDVVAVRNLLIQFIKVS
jgi:trehalose 6-phosphate synthase/phosphatase